MRLLIGRIVAVLACGLACGLAPAACAQPAADDGVASAQGTAPSPNPDPPDRRRWAQCMREHGIDVADSRKYDPGAFDKKLAGPAEQACRPFLPPDTGQTRVMDAAELEMWRRWAQCMRAQGIDVEDPDPTAGPPGPRTTKVPLDQVIKAEDACQNSAPPTRGIN